jgi:uncharacterized membrane protein
VEEQPVAQKDLSSLERGRDLSRVVAFTDGVFAIAITLLVLQLDVPTDIANASELWSALGRQSDDFVAFAISFAVIGRYWYLDHRFMRMIREFDPRLMALNLAYLFFIVLIPFTSQLMGEHGSEVPASVAIYIGNIALVTLFAGLMYRHADSHHLVHPEYRAMVSVGGRAVFVIGAIFLATIPLALVLGPYTPLLWIPLMRLNPYDRSRRTIIDLTSKDFETDQGSDEPSAGRDGTEGADGSSDGN